MRGGGDSSESKKSLTPASLTPAEQSCLLEPGTYRIQTQLVDNDCGLVLPAIKSSEVESSTMGFDKVVADLEKQLKAKCSLSQVVDKSDCTFITDITCYGNDGSMRLNVYETKTSPTSADRLEEITVDDGISKCYAAYEGTEEKIR